MGYAQWKWRRERAKVDKEEHDNYYVAQGTNARVLEDGNPNSDVKNHITRNDLVFTASEEVDAPPGWRAFKRSGYIIQFEAQDVFYSDLCSIF
jgi:hypothetical protein